MENIRAAIYGAGAMGTVLGAYITRAGGKIDLITRNIEHVAALKSGGARISGQVNFTVPVSALTPDEMKGQYDIIILMTKQRHNKETVSFLAPYLSPEGVICTAQNGLPEDSVAEVIGRERTLGCAVSWGATFIGGGEAKLTSSPDKLTFALGSPYGANDMTGAVAKLLAMMGDVTIEDNFSGARWAKIAINSAFSPLSAMSGKTFGEIANNKKYRRLAQLLLKECFTAAEASGVKMGKIQGHDLKKIYDYNCRVKRAISFALMPLAMKNHKNLVSGMYYDLSAGKPCEIDFINGKIIAAAKSFGVNLPVNSAAVDIIHDIERGVAKTGEENLSILCEQFL